MKAYVLHIFVHKKKFNFINTLYPQDNKCHKATLKLFFFFWRCRTKCEREIYVKP